MKQIEFYIAYSDKNNNQVVEIKNFLLPEVEGIDRILEDFERISEYCENKSLKIKIGIYNYIEE